MHFPDDKKEIVPLTGIGIVREATGRDVLASLERKDIEARERGRADKEGGGEQEHVIEVFEAQEGLRSTQGNDTKKDLFLGKGMRVEQVRTEGHREDGRDEAARFECSLHQALARASAGWDLSEPGCAVRRASRHLR